jgi:hypothetical protein
LIARPVRRLGLAALVVFLPLDLRGQTPVPADSGRLVLIVAQEQHQSSREEPVAIAGARAALKSGALLGTSSDSGVVVVEGLPVGRIEITFRAREYAPLSCRLNVRPGVEDTVRVNMQLERRVAVWSSPGCKQRR